jgi:hypothetical protein
MSWYKNLPPEFIDSWRELCRQFTAHFTASWRQPNTIEAILQRGNEPLRDYIEMFNRAAVELRTDDQMKLYLLDRGLRLGRILLKHSESKRLVPFMLCSRKHKNIYSVRTNKWLPTSEYQST